MIKSLLLKLGMLSMAIGVVFWVRWAPQSPVHNIPSTPEQHVTINTVTQPEPSQTPIRSRLDLNRASAGELESLPGIGAVLAQRVIAFRESVGRFQKVEDLRGVKGIGAKKFERLKSFVTVSTPNSNGMTEQRIL